MPTVGDRVEGYRILELLGRGGAAEVFRALQESLDREVALKVLAPLIGPESDRVDRFRREIQLQIRLSHPDLVQIYDAGVTAGSPWLAMELVDGESLQAHIHRQGPLGFEEARRILRSIAGAVAYLHDEGIVHRDLKPANVMLTTLNRVKVVDFGLAVDDQQTRITRADQLLGTLAYLAPEVARGGPSGPPADVHALGLIGYEMLSRALPYEGQGGAGRLLQIATREPIPLCERRSDVPEELDRLISRALDRDPTARPTAAQVARVLGGSRLTRRIRKVRAGSREPEGVGGRWKVARGLFAAATLVAGLTLAAVRTADRVPEATERSVPAPVPGMGSGVGPTGTDAGRGSAPRRAGEPVVLLQKVLMATGSSIHFRCRTRRPVDLVVTVRHGDSVVLDASSGGPRHWHRLDAPVALAGSVLVRYETSEPGQIVIPRAEWLHPQPVGDASCRNRWTIPDEGRSTTDLHLLLDFKVPCFWTDYGSRVIGYFLAHPHDLYHPAAYQAAGLRGTPELLGPVISRLEDLSGRFSAGDGPAPVPEELNEAILGLCLAGDPASLEAVERFFLQLFERWPGRAGRSDPRDHRLGWIRSLSIPARYQPELARRLRDRAPAPEVLPFVDLTLPGVPPERFVEHLDPSRKTMARDMVGRLREWISLGEPVGEFYHRVREAPAAVRDLVCDLLLAIDRRPEASEALESWPGSPEEATRAAGAPPPAAAAGSASSRRLRLVRYRGTQGGPRHRDALLGLLDGADPALRETALRALASLRLAGPDPPGPTDPGPASKIAERAAGASRGTRLLALAAWDPPRTVPVALDALRNGTNLDHWFAGVALGLGGHALPPRGGFRWAEPDPDGRWQRYLDRSLGELWSQLRQILSEVATGRGRLHLVDPTFAGLDTGLALVPGDRVFVRLVAAARRRPGVPEDRGPLWVTTMGGLTVRLQVGARTWTLSTRELAGGKSLDVADDGRLLVLPILTHHQLAPVTTWTQGPDLYDGVGILQVHHQPGGPSED